MRAQRYYSTVTNVCLTSFTRDTAPLSRGLKDSGVIGQFILYLILLGQAVVLNFFRPNLALTLFTPAEDRSHTQIHTP